MSRHLRNRFLLSLLSMIMLGAFVSLPETAAAHCDTLDGPVVTDARAALESGDISAVLRWIKPEAEPEVRAAFGRTREVRRGGPAARELADQWFFETLVRVHRAGEGAPYTGLKPAGTEIEPGIEAADRALVSGSVEALAAHFAGAVDAGLRERFGRVATAAGSKESSVEAGRAYVSAYVEFIHWVEGVHAAITRGFAERHAAE